MVIDGTPGDDTLPGTPDADLIRGFGGSDTLLGESGDDTLIGGSGDDSMIGGRGNDTLNGTDTEAEIAAGLGFDVISYRTEGGLLGVTVNLATGIATDSFGDTDTLIDIEAVTGTNLADRLTGGDIGNDAFEDFRGLGGDDTIDGGSGFDRVTYNNDFGAGGTQGVDVNLGTGTATDGFGDTDTLLSIEAVRSTAFDDTLIGSGADNRFEPLSGADYIHGGGGNDRVAYHNDHFFLGNDNYVTGIKADLGKKIIVDTSGVHVDTVISIEDVMGSNLDDRIVGNAQDNQLFGRIGDDLLIGRGGDDLLNGDAGNDHLVGNGGNDFLFGGDGDDRLVGSGGDDNLQGHSGTDDLRAGGGNDFLHGNDGNDLVLAGAGNDWVEGGADDDFVVGGTGSDAYGFHLGDGHDLVKFIDGEDSLHFSGYDYTSADDVVAVAVQQGKHVVIAKDGDSVTLLNFDLADLDSGDIFLF